VAEKKGKRLEIRISKEELQQIIDLCWELDLSKSDLIRYLIKNYHENH